MIDIKNVAGLILDESRKIVKMLAARGLLPLLAELASRVPGISYDAQCCAVLQSFMMDMERNNQVCLFNSIGVPLSILTRVDNDLYKDPARALNSCVLGMLTDPPVYSVIACDTKYHAGEMAEGLCIAYKEIERYSDCVVIGIPTPEDPHPDLFAKACELSDLGISFIMVLIGASKTDREKILRMVNASFKGGAGLPGGCLALLTSNVIQDGITFESAAFYDDLQYILFIMGNKNLEMFDWAQAARRLRDGETLPDGSEPRRLKMRTAFSLGLQRSNLNLWKALSLPWAPSVPDVPVKVPLTIPDNYFFNDSYMPATADMFDPCWVRAINPGGCGTMMRHGDYRDETGEPVDFKDMCPLIQHCEEYDHRTFHEGRIMCAVQGCMIASGMRAFSRPLKTGVYVNPMDAHKALLSINDFGIKLFYTPARIFTSARLAIEYDPTNVELVQPYCDMLVAQIQGDATESMERGVEAHDLLDIWMGVDWKSDVDARTQHHESPAVKLVYANLVNQGCITVPDISSPEVMAVNGIFTVLHMLLFKSPDHTICRLMFHQYPRLIADIEFMIWLHRVLDDTIDGGLPHPFLDPKTKRYYNVYKAWAMELPDNWPSGEPVGGHWTPMGGGEGMLTMKMIRLAFEAGVASYACVLDRKNPAKDQLLATILEWRLGNPISVGMLIAQFYRMCSKIGCTDYMPTGGDVRQHRPTAETRPVMANVYVAALCGGEKSTKKDRHKELNRVEASIATAQWLIYHAYSKDNDLGFGMLPDEYRHMNGLSPYGKPFTAYPMALSIFNPFTEYLDVPNRGTPAPLFLSETAGRVDGRLSVGVWVVEVDSIRDLTRCGMLNSKNPELEVGEVAMAVRTGGPTQRRAAQYDPVRASIFVVTFQNDDTTPIPPAGIQITAITQQTITAVGEGGHTFVINNKRRVSDLPNDPVEAPSFQDVVDGWSGLKDVDAMTQPVSPVKETRPEEEIVSSQKSHISISSSPVFFGSQASNRSELGSQGDQARAMHIAELKQEVRQEAGQQAEHGIKEEEEESDTDDYSCIRPAKGFVTLLMGQTIAKMSNSVDLVSSSSQQSSPQIMSPPKKKTRLRQRRIVYSDTSQGSSPVIIPEPESNLVASPVIPLRVGSGSLREYSSPPFVPPRPKAWSSRDPISRMNISDLFDTEAHHSSQGTETTEATTESRSNITGVLSRSSLHSSDYETHESGEDSPPANDMTQYFQSSQLASETVCYYSTSDDDMMAVDQGVTVTHTPGHDNQAESPAKKEPRRSLFLSGGPPAAGPSSRPQPSVSSPSFTIEFSSFLA